MLSRSLRWPHSRRSSDEWMARHSYARSRDDRRSIVMSIIGWLIIGALAGWIASMIAGTNAQQGWLMNIVVGIVGAFIGGFLYSLLTGVNFAARLRPHHAGRGHARRGCPALHLPRRHGTHIQRLGEGGSRRRASDDQIAVREPPSRSTYDDTRGLQLVARAGRASRASPERYGSTASAGALSPLEDTRPSGDKEEETVMTVTRPERDPNGGAVGPGDTAACPGRDSDAGSHDGREYAAARSVGSRAVGRRGHGRHADRGRRHPDPSDQWFGRA